MPRGETDLGNSKEKLLRVFLRIVIVRLHTSNKQRTFIYLDTTGLNIQEVVKKINEAKKEDIKCKPIDRYGFSKFNQNADFKGIIVIFEI